jgi:hypothetical protein
MKQAELDAAVKVVRDVVYAQMAKRGFAQYIPELEKQVDVVDVVRYGLQAAEDERNKEHADAELVTQYAKTRGESGS